MSFQNTIEFAKELDNKDALKSFRQKFYIPQYEEKDSVYLTCNSHSLQAKTTSQYVQQELDDWEKL